MPLSRLSHFILFNELKLNRVSKQSHAHTALHCEKKRIHEVCPKCANPSESTYDHRVVKVSDAPIRGTQITLVIRKRRLWCKHCRKPFTEPIAGIRKRKRHTERYDRSLRWACDTFSDLKQVRRQYRCSVRYLYDAYYRQLELRRRTKLSPWPKVLGIDEHAFRRNPTYGHTEFASMIVDYTNKRVKEVVEGKTTAALSDQLAYIPGRENVQSVVIDMCDPFKNFAREFFPEAKVVADKFHVLRLLSPALLRRRKEITTTRADLRAKKLLLMSSKKLSYSERFALKEFLYKYPDLYELWTWKEKLHKFYRTLGYHNASKALRNMINNMAWSLLPEIKTLRKTLMRWKEQILNYFLTGLTNARTEGFNNKAKVVKRRAYGYRSFKNYRLRVLDACS